MANSPTTPTREHDPSQMPSDIDNWAKPVGTFGTSTVPAGAIDPRLEGRSLTGPLQGFGPMWQKTYRIRLRGASATPAEV
jgi:hypothetical protein